MTKAIITAAWLFAGLAAALAVTTPAAAIEKKALTYYGATVEQLEYRAGEDSDDNMLAWDAEVFYGTDNAKLRLESEGEYIWKTEVFETLEFQGAVQIPISPFFDAKAGIRYDAPEGPDRAYAVVGLHGLAPQWIELDADVFLSEKGDFSARLDAEYELLITNRLTLIPSLEIGFAASDDLEIGIGAGFTSLELGARLTYDLVDRDIVPYIGVHWEQLLGQTAGFARAEGEDAGALFLVAGLRLSF